MQTDANVKRILKKYNQKKPGYWPQACEENKQSPVSDEKTEKTRGIALFFYVKLRHKTGPLSSLQYQARVKSGAQTSVCAPDDDGRAKPLARPPDGTDIGFRKRGEVSR